MLKTQNICNVPGINEMLSDISRNILLEKYLVLIIITPFWNESRRF